MKQNRRMAVCAVLLMICLLMGSLLPVSTSAKAVSEESGSLPMIQLEPMQEFGTAASISAEVDGSVELIDGTAVKWIDRVVLPDSIRALYDTLVEGADADGDHDILIEDRYYMDPDFSITVATETVSLNGKEPEEITNEVIYRYLPFVYTVLAAFDRDHPEVFWLDNDYWKIQPMRSVEGNKCSVSLEIYIDQIRAASYATEALIRQAIAQRDAAVADICKDFTAQTTRYERVAHFNEVLTKRNEYNTSSNLNHLPHDARKCISALLGGTGTNGPVCEGYARALKVLCDAENIPCVLVDGVASSRVGHSEAHMWNYVQMGDKNWYAVDVTWNDPVTNATGAVSGAESKDWLLVGGNTEIGGRSFAQTHTVRNRAYDDTDQIIATRFTNGPTLQDNAYDAQLDIALNIPDGGYVYDGEEKEPSLTVKRNGVPLNPATDYTVQYANHKNAGTASVTVTGKGQYADLTGKEIFVIRPRELHPTVTVQDKIYDGTDTAEVSVSFSSEDLLAQDKDVQIAAAGVFVSVFARKQTEVRITLTLSGENSKNYTVQNPTEVYAEIKRRPVTVYADALTTTTDEFEGLTYTIDPATPLVEGESLSGKLNFEKTDTEGIYDIVQGTLTDKNNLNYEITFVSAKLTLDSSNTNQSGGQSSLGLGDLADLSSLLEQDWLMYLAIGAGAFVVVFVAVFAIVGAMRKHRRG